MPTVPTATRPLDGVRIDEVSSFVAVPLAAGVLTPIGILLPPAAAAVLMSLSTIVVALNAQLLRRIDLDPTHLAPTSTKEEHTTPTPASTAVH